MPRDPVSWKKAIDRRLDAMADALLALIAGGLAAMAALWLARMLP